MGVFIFLKLGHAFVFKHVGCHDFAILFDIDGQFHLIVAIRKTIVELQSPESVCD